MLSFALVRQDVHLKIRQKFTLKLNFRSMKFSVNVFYKSDTIVKGYFGISNKYVAKFLAKPATDNLRIHILSYMERT